jgi:hypothetical protein
VVFLFQKRSYFYEMTDEELKSNVLKFFEEIQKYYGSKTEITSGLYTNMEDFDSHNITWNLSEFELIRAAYRKKGERFMMEGKSMYVELSAKNILSFEKKGRNKFEFIEQYSPSVYRMTTIKFNYKY